MAAHIHVYAGNSLNPIGNSYQQQGEFVSEAALAKVAKSITRLGQCGK